MGTDLGTEVLSAALLVERLVTRGSSPPRFGILRHRRSLSRRRQETHPTSRGASFRDGRLRILLGALVLVVHLGNQFNSVMRLRGMSVADSQ